MSRSIDDLLGTDDEPAEPFEIGNWADVRHRGVGIDWLAGAFGMDRRRVRSKLAGLKPIGEHKTPTGMRPLWDLREAAAHLVPSSQAVQMAIRDMKASDLPPDLQKEVWDARLKEMQWREKAGELWPTEGVIDVLGEAFKRLKTTLQLVPDQIERDMELPPTIRTKITDIIDRLQVDLHATLVEMPASRGTMSYESTIPRLGNNDDE